MVNASPDPLQARALAMALPKLLVLSLVLACLGQALAQNPTTACTASNPNNCNNPEQLPLSL